MKLLHSKKKEEEEEGSGGSNGLGFLLVVVFIEQVGNPTVRFLKLCMYLLIAKISSSRILKSFHTKVTFYGLLPRRKITANLCAKMETTLQKFKNS
jgi:hypothetical protein